MGAKGRQTSDVPGKVARVIARRRLLEEGDLVLVGVSGGPDSLCLARVLVELGWGVHLAHLDHGLRGAEGQADARLVADLAAAWGVPCTLERTDVAALARERKLSVEEAAREARYEFLTRTARRVGAAAVAVGHQADDQVETVLMHFLRGASLSGLRGMRHRSRRLGVTILRPLLDVERSEIVAFLRERGLEPRFDRSNLDTTLFRNRLRHELIPRMETFNPRFGQVVRRAARGAQRDYAFIRRHVLRAAERLAEAGDGAYRVDRQGFLELPRALQSHLLRRLVFLAGARLRDFGFPATEQALEAIRGRPGAMPLPGGLTLWVSYRAFTIGRELPRPDWPLVSQPVRLRVPGTTELGAGWVARAEWRPPGEATFGRETPTWEAWLDARSVQGRLWLRPREPGDRFQPLGMEGHKSLRDFLADERIPRPWRDRLPLLVCGQEILWVAGWRISHRARLRPDSPGALHLRLEHGGDPGRTGEEP